SAFIYTFIPVKPVLLGESVMFNCDLPNMEISQRQVNWYKQSPGENLRLIVKFTLRHQKPAASVLSPEFSDSRWVIGVNETLSSLKILRATQEDEGIYHCVVMDWIGTNKWNGTYLIVKDHGTLQCSVFTDLENKMCLEDLSVFWLRAEAEESHPDIIYIDNNKRGECKKKSDSENSCFYHFSKNITSPDSAFYYCAIATCGKILFGNAIKSKFGKSLQLIILVILAICLVISVIVNIVFICYQPLRTGCKCLKGKFELTTPRVLLYSENNVRAMVCFGEN
uniref:Ig-like domain-containing protein n=1 Tax=Xiphophorus maculatus TaxID=8083 RepID=A0A3B5Q6H4_XIPMA